MRGTYRLLLTIVSSWLSPHRKFKTVNTWSPTALVKCTQLKQKSIQTRQRPNQQHVQHKWSSMNSIVCRADGTAKLVSLVRPPAVTRQRLVPTVQLRFGRSRLLSFFLSRCPHDSRHALCPRRPLLALCAFHPVVNRLSWQRLAEDTQTWRWKHREKESWEWWHSSFLCASQKFWVAFIMIS